jgi:hypothetical protein
VVLFVLTVALLITLGISTSPFLLSPANVAGLLVVDVSESAIHSGEQGRWPNQICDRYHAHLIPGDLKSSIWFADQARVIGAIEVVNSKAVTHSLLAPACNLPPDPEVLAQHDLGDQPGTSLTRAIQVTQQQINQLRSQYPSTPIIVVIVLHQLEPGPTESRDLERLVMAIEALLQEADSVQLIGPQGEIATMLGEVFNRIDGATFCPFKHSDQDIDTCFRQAFAVARATTG